MLLSKTRLLILLLLAAIMAVSAKSAGGAHSSMAMIRRHHSHKQFLELPREVTDNLNFNLQVRAKDKDKKSKDGDDGYDDDSDASCSDRSRKSKSKQQHRHTSPPSHGQHYHSSNSSTSSDDSSEDNEDSKHGSGLAGKHFAGKCADPHASETSPNGNIHFLNCGISKAHSSSGHWSPPKVNMNQLSFASIEDAIASSAFKPCKKHKSIFEKVSKDMGVPAILFMAFAMQESTCNAAATGGNGEIGLMQLTGEKCKGKNCYDAKTNLEIAAAYFKKQLNHYDGNILEAIGTYNGWTRGMTYHQATSQKYGCKAQRNLDYLNQMLNGWCQAKDGSKLLVYNNLGSC